MELRDAVRARRMVRRFDPDRAVPDSVLRRIAALAVRAPSAGFSQGWDFVVLRTPQDRSRFWAASTDAAAPADPWLSGVSTAPVLIVCCSDPKRYADRYAEPDKSDVAATDRDAGRWPIPYWDVDTGMAAQLMLLGAVDEGLGGLFFGVPSRRMAAVRESLAIPGDRRLVGVVALGYSAQNGASGSTRGRSRRPVAEVFHEGRLGSPLR